MYVMCKERLGRDWKKLKKCFKVEKIDYLTRKIFDKDVNSFIFSFRQHRLLQTNHISLHPLHIFLCNTQDPLHILLEDVELLVVYNICKIHFHLQIDKSLNILQNVCILT
jgi:hypothetical protein